MTKLICFLSFLVVLTIKCQAAHIEFFDLEALEDFKLNITSFQIEEIDTELGGKVFKYIFGKRLPG